MEKFTVEQFQKAEQLAVETLRATEKETGQTCTPLEALYALSHCLFCTIQGTDNPSSTKEEMNGVGFILLLYHAWSKDFPYTAQQIIDDILARKQRASWSSPA